MAQMDWNKYPEVMPPADCAYLAVVEYDRGDNKKEYVVMPAFFMHNLSEASSDFKGEDHPGWFDSIPNYNDGCDDFFEIVVRYWMPYPELPKGVQP